MSTHAHTGGIPPGLRDGGHPPRHRRPLAHAPRYVYLYIERDTSIYMYLHVYSLSNTTHPTALTKGQYWRNEAALVATALVRFWLMLREDWGLFRRLLGRRTHMEV